MSGNHRDLIVWQKAMHLVLEVYQCTRSFPREETYGLVAQMRRAPASIPSNIAEGRGRYTSGETIRFLINARGSLLELETQLEIAAALGYITPQRNSGLEAETAEVGRLINGMLNHFKQLSRHSERLEPVTRDP